MGRKSKVPVKEVKRKETYYTRKRDLLHKEKSPVHKEKRPTTH